MNADLHPIRSVNPEFNKSEQSRICNMTVMNYIPPFACAVGKARSVLGGAVLLSGEGSRSTPGKERRAGTTGCAGSTPDPANLPLTEKNTSAIIIINKFTFGVPKS